MAGAIIPRAALRPILSSPCDIRSLPHLSSFPGRLGVARLGLGCSRAGPAWACWGSREYRRDVRVRLRRVEWGIERERQAFSTSLIRRDGKDGEKQGSKPVLKEDGKTPNPPTTKPLAALKQTLKTKVSSLRHENIYTIPNLLTFSRLLATPAIGYLIITNQPLYAFTLFLYAGFSDLLDGWIARRWHLQTVVGSVVDPMADKALMTTLVTCLAVNGSLSLPLATLILGRDISLAVAALYYRYASLPAPKTWGRYWDFSLPSAEVHPTTVSKYNTFLQLVLIGTIMCVSLLHDPAALDSVAGTYLERVQAALGGPESVDKMVLGMSGVVAATTLWSGLSYAFMKDAVKILGENEELKRRQGARGRMIVGGCFGAFICAAALLAWREVGRRNQLKEEAEAEGGKKEIQRP